MTPAEKKRAAAVIVVTLLGLIVFFGMLYWMFNYMEPLLAPIGQEPDAECENCKQTICLLSGGGKWESHISC